VLSVLQFMASDYHFGIFKLFFRIYFKKFTEQNIL